MAATDQDVGGHPDPYYEGDSLKLEFDVDKSGGGDKDLSNATAVWKVEHGSTVKLSDSDSGVSTSIDTSNNIVSVTLTTGTTDGLVGVHEHYLRVDDGNETITVATGDFIVDSR